MSDTADTDWYGNDASTFGDRVVAAREARNLNVKALAHHLGVAPKTVEKWENDISEPRANKLQMLSGVLNVSMRWLLTGEGGDIETDPADSAEIGTIMAEMRVLRTELLSAAERLGVLEKRLRKLGTS